MKQNVGMVSLVFLGPKTLWGLAGVLPLLTGLARFCPADEAMGMSTGGSCDLPNSKTK